jgi:alpha 1,2-mannosyltransferase
LERDRLNTALEQTPAYDRGIYHGNGIVIVVDPQSISVIYATIMMLRHKHQCTLPFELWYLKHEDSGASARALFLDLAVRWRAFEDVVAADMLQPIEANVGLRRFQLKPLAVLHSQFAEVLLLDSDNTPLRDPTFLFDSAEYLQHGAVFWPDYWVPSSDNPVFDLLGLDVPPSEQESGQLLVDKKRAWRGLQAAVLLNSAFFMRLLNGDKDTFQLGWLFAGLSFHMVSQPVTPVGMVSDGGHFCGHAMLQHAPAGEELFLHHNQVKNAERFSVIRHSHMKVASQSAAVRPSSSLVVAGFEVFCVDLTSPAHLPFFVDTGVKIERTSRAVEAFEAYFAAALGELSSRA